MQRPQQQVWLIPLVSVGFLLSGIAGLVDEVVWSKYLPLLIGGTTLSQTIVLATFMGGLALGNWVFGRRVDRSPNSLRFYALLELGIGILCFGFPEIFSFVGRIYVLTAAPLGFGHPWAVVLKTTLAVTVIFLPTFLMGGTLPVLTKTIVRDMSGVTQAVARLYFINSLGAVIGVFASGFLLVQAFGLEMTIRGSGLVNIALGLIFLVASRHISTDSTIEESPPARPAEMPRKSFTAKQQRTVMFVIAVSGGVSMLYEVVWTRLLTLVLGSSTYSFSIMLLTFIAGITTGAWIIGQFFKEKHDAIMWFAIAEFGIFVSIACMIPFYDRLPLLFAGIAAHLERSQEFFALYICIKVSISCVLMFLPATCIGMTLPLASRVAVDRIDVLGRKVGSVFSVNTVGTVLGASGTGLILIPAVGLRTTLEIGLMLSMSLGIILLLQTTTAKPLRQTISGLAVVALAGALLLTPEWNEKALHFGLYRFSQVSARSQAELVEALEDYRIEFSSHGIDSSIAVIRNLHTGIIYLKVNGKTEAGSGGDMSTQLWLGHLGFFLNPGARRGAVIGLGSGITPAAALAHPGVEVDVIEISSAVVEGSQWFTPFTGNLGNNPRFKLHIGDAKEFFKLRPGEKWDVIISEPSNPWQSGVSALFSLEFFREIQSHLAPGGLLVQWLQIYELDNDLLKLTFNTLTATFPHVELWQCSSNDLLVVASNEAITVNREDITRKLATGSISASLNFVAEDPPINDTPSFLLNQLLSDTRFRRLFPGEPPFNSDTRPILEYRAPRAFFAGHQADLLLNLDERRLPVEQSATHLATLLKKQPLTEHEARNIITFLRGRPWKANRALLTSMTWRQHDKDPTRTLSQRLFNDHGDAALETLLASDQTATRVRAKAQLIREATSLLYQPDTSTFLKDLDQLIDTGDRVLSDPSFITTVWHALYIIGESDRIATWPGPLPQGAVADPTSLRKDPLPFVDLQNMLIDRDPKH